MIWASLVLVLASFILVFKNVQPLWLQYLGFAVALSLFIINFFRSMPQSERLRFFIKKNIIFLTLIPTLLFLNFVARKYEHVWDLSFLRVTSLTPQTVEWLKKIEQPIQIYIFASRDDKSNTALQRFKKTLSHHTKHIDFYIKNITTEINMARQYNVAVPGEAVIIMGDNWTKIDQMNEKNLMTGISRLLTKNQSLLCFVEGHGEPSINNENKEGLSILALKLKDMGYSIRPVSFVSNSYEEMNACEVFVFINSVKTLYEAESDFMFSSLKEGKKFIYSFSSIPSLELGEYFEGLGLVLTGELIADPENTKKNLKLTDISFDHYKHPITDGLVQSAYLPEVQELKINNEEGSLINWVPLFQTNPNSSYILVNPDYDRDRHVFILAVTGTLKPKQGPTIVALGTEKIFLNQYIEYADNADIFFHSIKWLLEDKIVQMSQDYIKQEAKMDINQEDLFIIKSIVFYLIPGFVFIGLLFVWYRHKKV